jgi:hypothetical protein
MAFGVFLDFGFIFASDLDTSRNEHAGWPPPSVGVAWRTPGLRAPDPARARVFPRPTETTDQMVPEGRRYGAIQSGVSKRPSESIIVSNFAGSPRLNCSVDLRDLRVYAARRVA